MVHDISIYNTNTLKNDFINYISDFESAEAEAKVEWFVIHWLLSEKSGEESIYGKQMTRWSQHTNISSCLRESKICSLG